MPNPTIATETTLELVAPSAEQQAALEAHGTRFTALADQLAPFGGSHLVIAPGDELTLEQILAEARLLDARAVEHVPGKPSSCHRNIAARFRLGQCAIATGYALSGGYWRQHTWGVKPDGTLVETTEPRDAYWGRILDLGAALVFAAAELQDCCDPEWREFNVGAVRTTLSDTIADLLHIHGGRRERILEELAVALDAAETHYDSEAAGRDAPLVVPTVTDDDELHQTRLERDSHPRLVALSKDAYSTACGAVTSHEIVGERISSDAWPELQVTFPVSDYLPDGVRVRGSSFGPRKSAAVENFLFEVDECLAVAGIAVEHVARDGGRWAITARIALEDGYSLEDLVDVAEPLHPAEEAAEVIGAGPADGPFA